MDLQKNSFLHKLKPMRYVPFNPVLKYTAHQTYEKQPTRK